MKYLVIVRRMLWILGLALLTIPSAVSAQTSSDYTVELTLWPDYVSHRVDVVGVFQDVGTCQDLASLNWFTQMQVFPTADATKDRKCPFFVPQMGRLESLANGNYLLKLADLGLSSDNTQLSFIVMSADLLNTSVQPDKDGTRKGILQPKTQQWELHGPIDNLQITIHPWTVSTQLIAVPLLTEKLRKHIGADVLLSGTATISDIEDIDSYNALVGRTGDQYAVPTLDATLMALIDYPPVQDSDAYPGLRYLQALNKPDASQRQTVFQTTIGDHSILPDKKTGQITFDFTGYQRFTNATARFESHCPSIRQVDPNTAQTLQGARSVSFCVWLGPQDRLSIQMPNSLISDVSIPANHRQGADTLDYQGPGRFEIMLHFTGLPGNLVPQTLFFVRAWAADVETSMTTLVQSLPLGALGIGLLAVCGSFILTRITVFGNLDAQKCPQSQKAVDWRRTVSGIAAESVLWFLVGAILLYGTPTITSLLLLSAVVIAPYITRKDTRLTHEILVLGIFIIIVIVENFLVLSRHTVAADGQSQIQIYTPYSIAAILAVLIAGYYPWGQDEDDRENNYLLDKRRLPAYTMFFLIAATYDVIDHSLLSLFVVVLFVAFLTIRVRLSGPVPEPTKSDDHDKPSAPPQRWSRHLDRLLNAPLLFAAILILALIAIHPNFTSLSDIVFTLLTFAASALLFASLYDFIPPKSGGYIKAILFSVPLWLVFLLGIGTFDRELNIPQFAAAIGMTSRYALFINQIGSLLVGRIIFYVTVPLLVGLYLEYQEQNVRLKANGKALNSPRQFLQAVSTSGSVAATIVSALIPSIYQIVTQQPAISTFVDLLRRILNGS